MELVLALGVILVLYVGIPGGLIWGAIRGYRWYTAAQAAGQQAAEVRALELLEEFPQLSDQELGQIMLDECINQRRGGAYQRWSGPATVARVRRTVALEVARRMR